MLAMFLLAGAVGVAPSVDKVHVVSLRDAARVVALRDLSAGERVTTIRAPEPINKLWWAGPIAGALADAGSSVYVFNRGGRELNSDNENKVIGTGVDRLGRVRIHHESHSPTFGTIVKAKAPGILATTAAVILLDKTGHPNVARMVSGVSFGMQAGAATINMTVGF